MTMVSDSKAFTQDFFPGVSGNAVVKSVKSHVNVEMICGFSKYLGFGISLESREMFFSYLQRGYNPF
jgi:hypothetical protein